MDSALRIPRSADVLLHPTWLITQQTLPSLLAFGVRARVSGKRAHFMCCADESDRLLRRWGFRGALVGLAAYLNEHTFHVASDEKRYDAVYAARMTPYKRLYLASDVKSLFVQTYGERKTASGEYDLHGYEPRISHCDFNRGWVSAESIVAIYNSAKVGLALSAVEGAMLACVEYMLCGLPVVSTECRGGREKFFDPRYVKVVEATPHAVAAAVDRFLAESTDSKLIRTSTIEKMTEHRRRLADYVRQVIKKRGAQPPGHDAMMDHLFGTTDSIKATYVHRTEYQKHGLS